MKLIANGTTKSAQHNALVDIAQAARVPTSRAGVHSVNYLDPQCHAWQSGCS